ncbi:hypothetical protein [Cocleimonas flava]|uniref:Uncharacterized protein n=1 Tax=Cocleimonas flava TaxID=634765 RepID=A0A4R1F037_9GAMM|nr:hypothetical protein [Cocleimonas flava]TCJ87537.1 hypothetical protein EV695_2048 [Cocleimonas flava]
MNKLTLFKQIIFWLESIATLMILCFGIFLTIMLLAGGSNFLESITALFSFTWYLIKVAIQSFSKVPIVAISSLSGYLLYLGSLFYFAQSEKERKMLKFIIPSSFVAILLCAIGIAGAVMSGLANQGAGH